MDIRLILGGGEDDDAGGEGGCWGGRRGGCEKGDDELGEGTGASGIGVLDRQVVCLSGLQGER